MNLSAIINPRAVAENWSEVSSTADPYLGAGLFPAAKKAGLDLAWLKGNGGVPISLMPSAFDAQATFRDRIPVEKVEAEMPFFREGRKIKEKDRQELLRVQDANDPYAMAVLNRVYDDANDLVKGALVALERMRMQLLFAENGNLGISIKANGVDYTYNYDPNGTWKASNYTALSGTSVWTNTANADPFGDIETAQNNIRANTGAELSVAVMNSYTFNLLSKIDAVKNRFFAAAGNTPAFITRGDVQRVFADTNNIQFAVYDAMYRTEDGETTGSRVASKFVPDGYVALIPAGTLGSTWFGTTPEEADGENVALVETGIAVSTIVEPHPVNVNTIVSEIALPSYERADEVALIKVV